VIDTVIEVPIDPDNTTVCLPSVPAGKVIVPDPAPLEPTVIVLMVFFDEALAYQTTLTFSPDLNPCRPIVDCALAGPDVLETEALAVTVKVRLTVRPLDLPLTIIVCAPLLASGIVNVMVAAPDELEFFPPIITAVESQ